MSHCPSLPDPKFYGNCAVVFELCAKRPNYVHNYCVAKVGDRPRGARVHKLDCYLYRKMRKSQEQYP